MEENVSLTINDPFKLSSGNQLTGPKSALNYYSLHLKYNSMYRYDTLDRLALVNMTKIKTLLCHYGNRYSTVTVWYHTVDISFQIRP